MPAVTDSPRPLTATCPGCVRSLLSTPRTIAGLMAATRALCAECRAAREERRAKRLRRLQGMEARP